MGVAGRGREGRSARDTRELTMPGPKGGSHRSKASCYTVSSLLYEVKEGIPRKRSFPWLGNAAGEAWPPMNKRLKHCWGRLVKARDDNMR